jgi:hypothetical protein
MPRSWKSKAIPLPTLWATPKKFYFRFRGKCFVTVLASVCTGATLVTHIQFEEYGKGGAEENTWTKNK